MVITTERGTFDLYRHVFEPAGQRRRVFFRMYLQGQDSGVEITRNGEFIPAGLPLAGILGGARPAPLPATRRRAPQYPGA
jgi:hypothetical protein